MDFQKIQLTKQGTLNATYKNADGDVITFAGANVVHKDLKQAMQALIPHLALITEQREAWNSNLAKLREQRISDDGDNVYKRMNVDGITFTSEGNRVTITGTRILTRGGVITVTSPSVGLDDRDDYKNTDELALDIEAVVYECKEYIEQRKWGVKQAQIEFADIDPYKAEAGDVPDAGQQKAKRGRKSKKQAA